MLATSIGTPVRKYRPPRLATASPWQGWRPLFRRQNPAPNAWADFADGRLALPLRLCLPPYPAEIPSPPLRTLPPMLPYQFPANELEFS
jgi:hypothetical protein